jgi:hypothetical protein
MGCSCLNPVDGGLEYLKRSGRLFYSSYSSSNWKEIIRLPMKSSIRIIPVLLAVATLAHSQDEVSPVSGEFESAPATITTARILGEIPDGTPPPPALPKPVYLVAARDILSTATHEQGGRTITIREIKPIALPPPPPAEITLAEPDAEFSQRLAEYREAHPKNELLFLGATVFRSKDSPPRTLIRWWPQGGKGSITFWSSADFALIAGGINSFADSAGDTHHLLMGWGNVDLDRMAELYAAKDREYDAPDLPDFPEGKATFQITGESQPTAEERVVIESLHDIYNSELARLKTAYEGRERARIEREEYLKANPPQPKDITLNYWRTETPAASSKGGAK